MLTRTTSCSDETRYTFRVLSFAADIVGPYALLGAPTIFPRVYGTALPSEQPDHRQGSDATLTFDYDPSAPGLLEWQVVQSAVNHLKHDFFVFHAGAVAVNGRGCLLPGRSGSGKTTLTAALVASGLTYLSDEIGIVSPTAAQMLHFPKSMSVKAGSRTALSSYYPGLATLAARQRPTGEHVWHLPPPMAAWPTGAVSLETIVFPRYVSHGQTTLTPLARIDALPRLLDHLFELGCPDQFGMGRLVEAVQRADCYELRFSDLDRATRLMLDLLEA